MDVAQPGSALRLQVEWETILVKPKPGHSSLVALRSMMRQCLSRGVQAPLVSLDRLPYQLYTPQHRQTPQHIQILLRTGTGPPSPDVPVRAAYGRPWQIWNEHYFPGQFHHRGQDLALHNAATTA